jgi:hypothetical protein
MSARTLTLIALSLFLGLGAAWMANNWLSARLNASPDDNLQNVVVATLEIPFGQMVEAQQVTLVRMPKDTVPDDSFQAIDQVVGKIATFSMRDRRRRPGQGRPGRKGRRGRCRSGPQVPTAATPGRHFLPGPRGGRGAGKQFF